MPESLAVKETRDVDLHRLAHYCLDLADMFDTDRGVPIAIFLRTAGAAPPTLVLGTERHTYLKFSYLSCKLAETPAEHWWDSNNLVARVNLPNMQWPEDRKVEVYAKAVRGLLALEPDGGKRAKYIDFIDIYASLTENERRHYRRQYPEEGATMAGIVQRARDEGMQQGRVEGERAVLERLLRRRFGLLSPEITERLGEASEGELETWADNVLDAGTLDEVFDSDT